VAVRSTKLPHMTNMLLSVIFSSPIHSPLHKLARKYAFIHIIPDILDRRN